MTTRDPPEADLTANWLDTILLRYANLPFGQAEGIECRDAILAALDGWTLVPGGGDVIERGIELARQQAAEILRLRRAMQNALPLDALAAHRLLRAALAAQEDSEPPPIHVYPVGEGHEMSEDCWCHPKVRTP